MLWLLGYTSATDDDYEGWVEGDLPSAIYAALDKLERLDPSTKDEPWFQFLGKSVGQTLAPHLKGHESD